MHHLPSITTPRRSRGPLAAALLLAAASPLRAQVPPQVAAHLHTFDTPHYIMHTDIDDADAREADLRMTRMFEEYQRRTAGFSGTLAGKFPFFLFKKPEDYYASGAVPGSDGVFIIDRFGGRLMAIAGEHADNGTWHIVQHEGFHQFAAGTIRGELPVWVNEGIAEYFGEAVFTGDGFVSGIIRPERLAEVKKAIQAKTFKPFDTMMTMSAAEWGNNLDYANYTQAWAMVQFLAQGENGRYTKAFTQFMNNLNRGLPGPLAWSAVFGKDTTGFQARFEKWWMSQPKNPTRELELRAAVATLTSFFARATLQKQSFADVDTFVKTVKLPDLHSNRDLWLPKKLFDETSPAVDAVGKWTIETAKNQLPRLVCTDRDGARYVGSFTLVNNRVKDVQVAEVPPLGSPEKSAGMTH